MSDGKGDEKRPRVEKLYADLFAAVKGSVRAKVRLVTPEQASEWLEKRNTHNRPLSDLFAGRYAADMRGGRWAVNGQGVVFADNGTLLDGQHRLKGIVVAGVAVPLMVVEGVPSTAFDTLDQGRKRSFGQYLAMDGEKQSCALAAAVQWVQVLTGENPAAVRQKSIADQYAALGKHGGLRESVAYVRPFVKRGVFEPGPFTALHYLATARHPGDVTTKFFAQLFTGENVTRANPVYWLREQLHQPGPRRLHPLHKMAIAVKAFNATVAGKPVRTLKWSETEEFPELV